MPCLRAKLLSMNVPPAPESIRAEVSMVQSMVTGMRIDLLSIVPSITGETVVASRSDIDTDGFFKNPLPTDPSALVRVDQSWHGDRRWDRH